LSAVAPLAVAQEYPARTIRMVVPNPPGGPADWLGRAVAAQLEKRLGKPVVVENRTGAGSYTGSEFVSRAEPDGYTLLLSGNTMASYPVFLKDNRIDPVRSFAPLSLAMEAPWIIVAPATVPARTLRDYLAYARANPRKLNFAIVTNSNQQLDTMRFLKQAGVEVTLINYAGSAPVYVALLANEVQGYFGAYSAIAPHAKAGKLVPLAVAGSQRVSLMPEVPTAREAGLDFEAATWFGFYAPAGTPAPVVAKLAEAIAVPVKVDLAPKIRELGWEPVGSAPEVLARLMAKEAAVYLEMANAVGIQPP
jgi:tripartite-type tricarboxylate transporter receptor subunit TctC